MNESFFPHKDLIPQHKFYLGSSLECKWRFMAKGNHPKSPKNKRSIPTPILFTLGPCTKSLNPSQPGREHAEKMIPHPIEAPLVLGSMKDGWFWVLEFGVRNERGRV